MKGAVAVAGLVDGRAAVKAIDLVGTSVGKMAGDLAGGTAAKRDIQQVEVKADERAAAKVGL
jgi:hypothetical protein